MTEHSNDNRAPNTGAGSRQQEQQTAGGSFENERLNPGGRDPGQSGADQTNQQGRAPQQQDDREGLSEEAARTAQPGWSGTEGQQEQQSGNPQDGAGTAGSSSGADTRGGNQTNR